MKVENLIVGGGIAGLTAAAFLVKAGKAVTVLEKEQKPGGLVNSFTRKGVLFDGGIRSLEDTRILFPMLKQLGIQMNFVRSQVTVGIEDYTLRINNEENINEYRDLLIHFYPENKEEIQNIFKTIGTVMSYMDVLYGIDNPAFLDLKNNHRFLFKEFLPWLYRYLLTINKILKLNYPVEDFISRFTSNQSLIDMIVQHFFRSTPTFFALSYFKLYNDYHYPLGGTGTLVERLTEYITDREGIILTNRRADELHPEEKVLLDITGEGFSYDSLLWAADSKTLYRIIDIEKIKSRKLSKTVKRKREELELLHGGDSVFTVYLTLEKDKEFFSQKCSEHFFYTSKTKGLSSVDQNYLTHYRETGKIDLLKEYVKQFCLLNTFEISIPVLRDDTLAPPGKTGLIVSLLFDYDLTKIIKEKGHLEIFKKIMEEAMIDTLDKGVFKRMKDSIIDQFSSTPLTIERISGNSHGAITGWAFTNSFMPVVHTLPRIFHSVNTPLPSVYQAGQWTYSPSGFPISIVTGKLASEKMLKGKRR
ncbi:MAG: NAD(P)/FAD-dependent oxidoreductase [Spirochaetaceae bacterium]|nr:NAD(P)/FAD-dependent oxidoreductase [Spirochaetaceae bacterium]